MAVIFAFLIGSLVAESGVERTKEKTTVVWVLLSVLICNLFFMIPAVKYLVHRSAFLEKWEDKILASGRCVCEHRDMARQGAEYEFERRRNNMMFALPSTARKRETENSEMLRFQAAVKKAVLQTLEEQRLSRLPLPNVSFLEQSPVRQSTDSEFGRESSLTAFENMRTGRAFHNTTKRPKVNMQKLMAIARFKTNMNQANNKA